VNDAAVGSVVVTAADSTVNKNTNTPVWATVKDAGGKPLQGRTVAWSVPGGDPVTLSTLSSATSTGANSMATTTAMAKPVLITDTARITATVGGRSGSVMITVSP
jgi:hypothetical protein